MKSFLSLVKGYRIWAMWVAALAVLLWYYLTDPDGGAETLTRLQWLAWVAVIAGPVYWLRRALLGQQARSAEAYDNAIKHPVGAGLVFLGMCILMGAIFLALAGRANAASAASANPLPPGAVQYLPALEAEQERFWPDMPLRSALAAQVEQETCASLVSGAGTRAPNSRPSASTASAWANSPSRPGSITSRRPASSIPAWPTGGSKTAMTRCASCAHWC